MVTGPELLDYTTSAQKLKENDRVLWPFLEATEPKLCESSLDHLILKIASPVIRRTFDLLHRRHNLYGLYPIDFDDVAQEVAMGLTRRLRILKEGPELKPIKDFANYVARATGNAYNGKVLENHPQRLILKNQASYFFSHDPLYSTWLDEQKSLLCGCASWRNLTTEVGPAEVAHLVDQVRRNLIATNYPIMNPQDVPLPELAFRIFQIVNKPLRFSDFVKTVTLLWGLNNESSTSEKVEEIASENHMGEEHSLIAKMENRQTLRFLLQEIGRLPEHQCKALLYSIKVSQRSALLLIIREAIADVDELSLMLGTSKEGFKLMLFNELPLGDHEIGRRLGVTAEKARNFRKSGIERLTRRLAAYEKKQ